MEKSRYKKLEKLLLEDQLPNSASSIAFDLYENGVSSREWHENALPESCPDFKCVPLPIKISIYNALRDLELGFRKPTKYRLRKTDGKYLF